MSARCRVSIRQDDYDYLHNTIRQQQQLISELRAEIRDLKGAAMDHYPRPGTRWAWETTQAKGV